jgi:predicted N-acyltransferase
MIPACFLPPSPGEPLWSRWRNSVVAERLHIEQDIRRLPLAEWQRLECRHPALRPEVLGTLVASAAAEPQPHYLLLRDEAGVAAAAICTVVEPGRVQSADALLYGRAAPLLSRLGASKRPVLQVRAPLTGHSSVALRPAPSHEQVRLLGLLLDGIETHAAGHGLDLAFIGVAHDDQRLHEALRVRGYLDTQIHPTAVMRVTWRDFEGYHRMLQLRSRIAARTARGERNRNRRRGVTIRQVKAGTEETEALFRLLRDHYRLKNGCDPPFGAQFLISLAEQLGDDFLLFEAVREGHRVGMLGGIRWGSVAWLPWYGMEQRDRPNDFTYMNLVFYHLADAAPMLELDTLLYGNLALDAKRRRGCDIHANHLYYRPHSVAVRWLLRPYFWAHRQLYWRKLR